MDVVVASAAADRHYEFYSPASWRQTWLVVTSSRRRARSGPNATAWNIFRSGLTWQGWCRILCCIYIFVFYVRTAVVAPRVRNVINDMVFRCTHAENRRRELSEEKTKTIKTFSPRAVSVHRVYPCNVREPLHNNTITWTALHNVADDGDGLDNRFFFLFSITFIQ